ncbi:hypothetical protein B0A54_02738 [Friedmanniomyces endolithicus]|uniref:F-box domain-containing protein n=1 Tax=Friedmanniomyces endolithicus TaxID=329885 RepID=A0A4U0VDZ8_9PEZI|nr:hypothetical protein B0A54_02738 [Friedmanniomyces endolithicus]
MDSPARQVLQLPELLELVLLHLSQKDLLLSQRVSRSFRSTINHSIILQRALFLAPDWNLERIPLDLQNPTHYPGHKPANNRLLLRAFPGNYPTVSLVIVNDSPTPSEFATGRRGSEHWSWDVCVSFPADQLPHCVPAVAYQRSARPAMVREAGVTMGELFEEAVGARERGSWHRSFISSDRDWHFEGTIRCSLVGG